MSLKTRRAARPPKTVLVTGGAGFLGSYLCETLLGDGMRVICLDNFHTGSMQNLVAMERDSRFSLIEADVCDPLPDGLVVDGIFNLACPASPRHYQSDPVHTLMTSVVGTRNLLELARINGARLVQASTSEVYGDPAQHPQTEGYWGNVNPIGIRACYDEGKRAAESLCFDYLRRHATAVRVARIFNTYGPRMRADDGRIVSNLCIQALAGKPLTIYGTGEQTRSFCFVTDLIRGLRAFMDVDPTPVAPINIGNPEEFTINDLAETIIRMTGTHSSIVYEKLPADDPQCRRPDISRAQDILRWTPQVPLLEGLKATIAWFAQEQENEVAVNSKQGGFIRGLGDMPDHDGQPTVQSSF